MQNITVYEKDGSPLTGLVQWDVDVVVCIKDCEEIDKAYNVHFFNTDSNTDMAMVVTSTYEGGVLKAKIPNELLRQPFIIVGYVYIEKDDECKSIYRFTIPVKSRPQPSNYIFVETDDYIRLEKVLEECKEYSDSASKSASAAKTSEQNAKDSENNAKASQEAAANSSSDAQSSAAKALASENAASGYASSASQSASSASDSAAKALASQKAAENAQTAAKESETAAGKSADAAAASQSAAKTSQDEAAKSQAAAKESENNAKLAQTGAETAREAAVAAQGAAESAKEEATTQAQASSKSAAESAASADKSENWANQSHSWAVGEGYPTREDEKTNNSKYWAEQAKTSESNAKDSAAQASAQAQSATESASSASDSAAKALESQNAAETSKTDAESAAAEALQSQTAAKESETAASGYADNAKKSQDAAELSKTEAAESAKSADESAKLAQSIAQGQKGYFETEAQLNEKHPTGADGDWAIVGETDTIWVWDSDGEQWVDSGNKTDLSNYYTRTETDDKLGEKANATHDHNVSYYTKEETDTKLSGKADTPHTHQGSDISGAVAESTHATSADTATNATNAGTATKVANALTFTGGSTESYDGSAAKTVKIPSAASDVGAAASGHSHSDYLPISGGTVTGTLVLSKTTDADGTTNVSPALIVGGTATTAHIQIDNNEIMAKSNGTTTTTLYLNSNGGDVNVGSATGRLIVGNKVKIYTDNEGGNIRLTAPDSYNGRFWEIDAYNGNFRIYTGIPGGVDLQALKLNTNGEVLINGKKASTSITANGEISITPSAANEPTLKAISYASTGFPGVPAVVACAGSGVIGTYVLGVGVTSITATGCNLCLCRKNTTATTVHWIAVYTQ